MKDLVHKVINVNMLIQKMTYIAGIINLPNVKKKIANFLIQKLKKDLIYNWNV